MPTTSFNSAVVVESYHIEPGIMQKITVSQHAEQYKAKHNHALVNYRFLNIDDRAWLVNLPGAV